MAAARPDRLTPRAAATPAARPDAAPAEARPPLRIVAPRHRRRRAGALAVVLVTAMFGVMLGLVAFQTKIAQEQLQLDRLERQAREEQLRYDRLRGEVAALEAPARIVEAAHQQGMVEPAEIHYVRTPPEAVAAVAAASGQAPSSSVTASGGGSGDPAAWGLVKPLVEGAP